MTTSPSNLCVALSLALALGSGWAHEKSRPHHTRGIPTAPAAGVTGAFDIIHTKVSTQGRVATFHMAVSRNAGAVKPTLSGKLAGSTVFSYVWPTSLDPSVVGFEPKSGILSLAVTAHADFDDTPLFDENGDGDVANDGNVWHSHWVVLQPDAACGKDALKVVDISPGSKPKLPKTWPGLPLLIDSPGWTPVFKGEVLEVRVPFDDIGVVHAAQFDGVTAALRVNASVHAPLLCVADVHKIASGTLSLPGRVDQ